MPSPQLPAQRLPAWSLLRALLALLLGLFLAGSSCRVSSCTGDCERPEDEEGGGRTETLVPAALLPTWGPRAGPAAPLVLPLFPAAERAAFGPRPKR